ncbi:MAG: DNA repair protein RadC [Candidatus Aenigmarchaeota archaeon]|nr:DNA repair protein RadC [Candidatus Aenigmarchaeota archaeon]
MLIKEMAVENRPRERLCNMGSAALSDAELLAIILKNGHRGENVIDMSNRLISKYGVDKLSACTLVELMEIKGMGAAKACQIISVFELGKRHTFSKKSKALVKNAKDVFDYVRNKMSGLDREQFAILHFDTKNNITKYDVVSVGILNASIIHPREIFKSAIKESSNSIILVHNHPSGDPTPSKEDEDVTKQLHKAGELLNIPILDHVIVGNNSYYSFKEEGDWF